MQPQISCNKQLALIFWSLLFSIAIIAQSIQPVFSQSVETGSSPDYPLNQFDTQTQLTASMKEFSGVHLGNKIYTNPDWNSTELQQIDPNLGGVWPSIVVVMSNQIYNIERHPPNYADPTLRCHVKEAKVRLPVAYNYLKRAAQAGTKVVVRLYPSPGNFDDWNIVYGAPGYRQNHILRAEQPAGGDYCQPEKYRTALDLAKEMVVIQNRNIISGFVAFGFEPANEPNIEWYGDDSKPEKFKDETWAAMDTYFTAVHDKVQMLSGNVRVFTPPMSQGAFAEGMSWNATCDKQELINSKLTGYDKMRNTYEYYSHGVSWHNYWNLGKETYVGCINGGQHVSWHFPQWMKDAIRNRSKPVVITEADLNSPPQGGNVADKNANSVVTANSLRRFFYSEFFYGRSSYGQDPDIALWLLNDNTNNLSVDHNWHEAYNDNGSVYKENDWFQDWYTGSEIWDSQDKLLKIQAFLGGPYVISTNSMKDDLRRVGCLSSNSRCLPTSDPYQLNTIVNPDLFDVTGANAIIDWVKVELRAASNSASVVATRAALLQQDGDVVSADGASLLNFNLLGDNRFYVAVRHRNHLGVMTATPVTLNTITPIVDFTNPGTATYGSNAQRKIDPDNNNDGGVVGNEVMMLWVGNTNGDKRIMAAGPNNDQNPILIEVATAPGNPSGNMNYIVLGYAVTDLNMDGKTIAAGPNNDKTPLLTSIFSYPANTSGNLNYVINERLP